MTVFHLGVSRDLRKARGDLQKAEQPLLCLEEFVFSPSVFTFAYSLFSHGFQEIGVFFHFTSHEIISNFTELHMLNQTHQVFV